MKTAYQATVFAREGSHQPLESGYAGVFLSVGVWSLPVFGLMMIGITDAMLNVQSHSIREFATSLSWLTGSSLVLTSFLQLVFARFLAHWIHVSDSRLINANLFGVLMLTTMISALIACVLAITLFNETFNYEILMIANFVLMSNVWIVIVFFAGSKRLKLIVTTFVVASLLTVLLVQLLMPFGLIGLLTALLIGHGVLFFSILGFALQACPVRVEFRFDFLNWTPVISTLMAIGFVYYLGLWVDKLMFRLSPGTSQLVIGPLRNSLIYDFPVFLAYLSIIPGMTVFALRMKTHFAIPSERYFAALDDNAHLSDVHRLCTEMVDAAREALLQIIRVQGATVLLLIILGPTLFQWLGLSQQYIPIYYVSLVGVGAQVLLLSVLTVLSYLEKLNYALGIAVLLLISNVAFTGLSLRLGPDFYGYGFGASMSLAAVTGIIVLSNRLGDLKHRACMNSHQTSVSAST